MQHHFHRAKTKVLTESSKADLCSFPITSVTALILLNHSLGAILAFCCPALQGFALAATSGLSADSSDFAGGSSLLICVVHCLTPFVTKRHHLKRVYLDNLIKICSPAFKLLDLMILIFSFSLPLRSSFVLS